MKTINLKKQLSDLMAAHHVPFHVEDEWVVPFSKLPAIRATWFPSESTGRLEVEILLDDHRVITESFAGIGTGDEGVNDALQSFCVNSFHVLLAAFWQVNDPEQVTVEEWNIQGKPFSAFIGNFGTRGSDGVEPVIPDKLFDVIEHTIKQESIEHDIAWFRCFFCDVSGEHIFEALKNNEIWESGVSALKSLPWINSEGYYSVRSFVVFKSNS